MKLVCDVRSVVLDDLPFVEPDCSAAKDFALKTHVGGFMVPLHHVGISLPAC
jgi:hypothetical protein